MKVLCPGDPFETRELVRASSQIKGPVYIRLGKNGEPTLHSEGTRIEVGSAVEIRSGDKLTLMATSNMLENALKLADLLEGRGLHCSVQSHHSMKPLDEQKIRNAIEKRAPILTLEEHSMIGGLGSAVADVIAQSGRGVKFKKIALPDDYCHRVGSQDVLRKHYGLDVEGLQKQVLEFLGSEI